MNSFRLCQWRIDDEQPRNKVGHEDTAVVDAKKNSPVVKLVDVW